MQPRWLEVPSEDFTNAESIFEFTDTRFDRHSSVAQPRWDDNYRRERVTPIILDAYFGVIAMGSRTTWRKMTLFRRSQGARGQRLSTKDTSVRRIAAIAMRASGPPRQK